MVQYFQDLTWVDVQCQTARKVFQDKTSSDDNISSPSIMPLAEMFILKPVIYFILEEIAALNYSSVLIPSEAHT